jgi:hypothetical protein
VVRWTQAVERHGDHGLESPVSRLLSTERIHKLINRLPDLQRQRSTAEAPLPEYMRPTVRATMQQAYSSQNIVVARRLLQNLVSSLRSEQQSDPPQPGLLIAVCGLAAVTARGPSRRSMSTRSF